MPERQRSRIIEVAAVLLLFAGITAYVAALPRSLNPADEATHLYEAKRILDGQVMYRDIFEIIPPGWMYLMAFLFRLFGTDIATARVTAAVIHGLTAAMVYLACRAAAARRGLALTAGVAYVAICPLAWPIASQHWLGTLLCTGLLLIAVAGDPDRTNRAFGMGLVLGLLIGVQHPRGLAMTAGAGAILFADALIRRRHGVPLSPPTRLVRQLAWLAAGIVLVVAPLSVWMVTGAGIEPVWRALVVHPLFSYAPVTRVAWGNVNIMTVGLSTYTFPAVLKYLPLVLTVTVPRLAAHLWVVRERGPAHVLAALTLLCLAAMASIAYFPDFIHIAFIAPLFLVAAAESAAWLLRRLSDLPPVAWRGGTRRLARMAAWVTAAVLLVIFALHLQRSFGRLHAAYRFARETAFGRVAFAREKEALLYDRVTELLRDVPSRELFCYPAISHLYLLVPADNPTRYGFFVYGYSTPAQIQEVLGILEARRLPYIVLLYPSLSPDDPVIEYVRRAYEPLSGDEAVGDLIYRRRRG
jgi:hypothetical protein